MKTQTPKKVGCRDMKKSIRLIATGIAISAVLTGSMINIPIIQAASVENKTTNATKDVDENGISESLKTALVSKKYFDSEDEITPESLAEFDPGPLGLSIYNSKITDISGLQYATKVTALDIGINDVSDLSPLKDLKLTRLSINSNPNLTDLSPLKDMTSLTYLHMENSNITDISVLKSMSKLSNVQMNNNHIIDFSPLYDKASLTSNNITISPQTISEDTKTLNKNNFSVNLNDYTSPEASVSGITAKVDSQNAELSVDDDANSVAVSNISSSDTLTVNFAETMTINGIEKTVDVTIKQPYVVGSGSIVTKSVNMKIGDKWNDNLGFESATDPFGEDLKVTDFDVDTGDLDTNTEGIYEVTYTSKDYPDLSAKAEVTVEKKSDNSGGNNSGNNGSNTDNVTDIDQKLLSSKENDSIAIYDANGNKVSDKTLNGLTDFNTSKKSEVNGTTYYQVGDNEWISENDVVEYFEYSGTVQTNSDSIKKLSQLNGKTSNRGLAQTTDWQSDRYATINNEKMYRVSTNEWVAADQTLEVTPISGVLKINSEAKLYHDNGKQSDRGLAENSDFVTDKIATINGEKMYRVSTNEWVPASQVTLK